MRALNLPERDGGWVPRAWMLRIGGAVCRRGGVSVKRRLGAASRANHFTHQPAFQLSGAEKSRKRGGASGNVGIKITIKIKKSG